MGEAWVYKPRATLKKFSYVLFVPVRGGQMKKGGFLLTFGLSLWLLSDCLYNLNKSYKILGYLHHIQVLCSQVCLHFFSSYWLYFSISNGGFSSSIKTQPLKQKGPQILFLWLTLIQIALANKGGYSNP